MGATKDGGSDVGGTRDGERTERGTISGGVYEVFRAICLKDIFRKEHDRSRNFLRLLKNENMKNGGLRRAINGQRKGRDG